MRSSFVLSAVACVVITHAHKQSTQLWTYPPGSLHKLENIAVRPNGKLLLTSSSQPCVYQYDPSEEHAKPQKLWCLSNVTSTLGIAEIDHDVFAVNFGNVSTNLRGVPGSFSIHTLNFQHGRQPEAQLLARIPNAEQLNGLTKVPNQDRLFAADSTLGVLFQVNITTRKSSIAMTDRHFLPEEGFPFGINGVHATENRLFVSTTGNRTFGVVDLDLTGEPKTPFQPIATAPNGTYFDDFALDLMNNMAYVALHSSTDLGSLASINLKNGDLQTVAGGDSPGMDLYQPTSVAFGRRHRSLFIVTAGSLNSTGTEPSGQLVELGFC